MDNPIKILFFSKIELCGLYTESAVRTLEMKDLLFFFAEVYIIQPVGHARASAGRGFLHRHKVNKEGKSLKMLANVGVKTPFPCI